MKTLTQHINEVLVKHNIKHVTETPNVMSYAQFISELNNTNILNRDNFDELWDRIYWPEEIDGDKEKCYDFICDEEHGNKQNSIIVEYDDYETMFIVTVEDNEDWEYYVRYLSKKDINKLKKKFNCKQ